MLPGFGPCLPREQATPLHDLSTTYPGKLPFQHVTNTDAYISQYSYPVNSMVRQAADQGYTATIAMTSYAGSKDC
jgi:hypothetical protein